MTRIPAAALAVGMTLLGIPACQKPAAKHPPAPASAARDSSPVPAVPVSSAGTPGGAVPSQPFTITLSSGGGFSGLTSGCTLTSLGEAKAWRKRPGAPEDVLWTRKAKADSAIAFAEALKEFLSVDLEETGNMTTRIQYTLPDSTYRWSISGAGASPQDPEPFRTWYARAEAFCRSLAPAP